MGESAGKRAKADKVEHIASPSASSSLAPTKHGQCERDVLFDRPVREELVILRDTRDDSTELWQTPARPRTDVFAVDEHITVIRDELAGEQLQHRGLTCARWPDQVDELPSLDVQSHVIERTSVRISLRSCPELYQCHGGHRSRYGHTRTQQRGTARWDSVDFLRLRLAVLHAAGNQDQVRYWRRLASKSTVCPMDLLPGALDQAMTRAALAMTRALAQAIRPTQALAHSVTDIGYEAKMLVSSTTTFANRAESGELDLSRIVRANASALREHAAGIEPLVSALARSNALAHLAVEAVEHAYLHAVSGRPIPGTSAAVLLRALWDDGETWASLAVQVCAGFCSLSDLVTVMSKNDAISLACANLEVDVANAVRVCVENNPAIPLADVRQATLVSVLH